VEAWQICVKGTRGNLDNLEDNGSAGNSGADTSDTSVDQSRRRFSRTAIASGAVLVSLGNRAAWGGEVVDCMSVMTLNSFQPDTGMFMSSPAGRPDHLKLDLATRIHEIGDPPDYIGVDPADPNWQTCQDIAVPDNVCLVQGTCPE
jgi:hypothetical protein